MKTLTQILFILGSAVSSFCQNSYEIGTKPIYILDTLTSKIIQEKRPIPQTSENSRTQWAKPSCLLDSSIIQYPNASGVPVNYSKSEYGYDSRFNNTSYKNFYGTNYNSGWTYSNKITSVYDNQDNLISQLEQNYNWTSNTWENNSIYINTYNTNNKLLSEISQNWNSQNNSWQNMSVFSYTYNSNNKPMICLFEEWDYNSVSPVIYNKYSYTYDIFNALGEIILQSRDSVNHLLVNKEKYLMTTSGNYLLNFVKQIWNSTHHAWENSYRYSNSFDAHNNLTSQLYEVWNHSSNLWVNQSKYTSSFDLNNNQTLQVYLSWNNNTNNWVNTGRTVSTYDSNNNKLSELTQTRDNMANNWINKTQTLNSYNNENKLVNQMQFDWNSLGHSWKYPAISNFYYNCHTVGLSEESLSGSSFMIYPNPAQSELTIKSEKEFTRVTILNLNGQVVFESQNTHTLNISTLEKGIYFIQLLDKNKTILQTQKFVKE